MEFPVEMWASLSVASLSVVGLLPAEAQSFTCSAFRASSLGEIFVGGFISLLMIALLLALIFYAIRNPSRHTLT